MYRLKCTYCKKISFTETEMPEPTDSEDPDCTMCGLGIMIMIEPKASCYLCGKPIYDNIDTSRLIRCGLCTSKRVEILTGGSWKPKRQVKTKKTKIRELRPIREST